MIILKILMSHKSCISETESFPKYNETEQKFVDSRIYVHPTSKTTGNLDAAYADENNQNYSAVANKIE